MVKGQQRVVAVIGDMIDSRQIKNRFEFQKGFARDLAQRDQWHATSPYTLTLGDEFQALYTETRGLFYDIFRIREYLYPVRCRFSISLGTITTPINHKQALGMDGPAFHQARKWIDHLKKTGQELSLVGLPDSQQALLHPAINILWAATEHWKPNRLKIMRMLIDESWDSPESYGLTITQRAINKNIREGRLHDWASLISAAESDLNQLLA